MGEFEHETSSRYESTRFRRVLAIGAHPDDVELGAGGFLARLARSGAHVTIAVMSVPSLAEQRIAEASRAAMLIGAEVDLVLGPEPVRIEDVPMYTLVAALDERVAKRRPDLVLTHSMGDVH